MHRRSFVSAAGMLGAFSMMSPSLMASVNSSPGDAGIEPVLLEPRPPLDHNGGLNVRTWVRSEMTGGVYSSVETAVAPKTMGPPPHYHQELDELMLVLEGTATVLVNKELVEVKAGGWHLRPRMITHTFWNNTDQPLRFIDMYFNQPFEQYLERIFFELTEKNGFPEGSEAKIKELQALNKKFGVIFPDNAFSDFEEIKKRYKLK